MKEPKTNFAFGINKESAFPTVDTKAPKTVAQASKKPKPKASPKKKESEIKNKKITAYLTESEYATYIENLDGRSASATARNMILNYES